MTTSTSEKIKIHIQALMKAAAELEDVVSALARHEVDYLLCGGFAVSLYGVPRITMDIDILLRFTEENIQRLITAATEEVCQFLAAKLGSPG